MLRSIQLLETNARNAQIQTQVNSLGERLAEKEREEVEERREEGEGGGEAGEGEGRARATKREYPLCTLEHLSD